MKYEIRPASKSDLDVLNEYMPSSINGPQIEDQLLGNSTFLIAMDGRNPVGRLVVHWDGATKEVIRTRTSGMPNISMLRTREDRRGQGIGTSLIEAAENLAAIKGYAHIGLSVATENKSARRLYQHMDYYDWEYGTYMQPRRKPSPGQGVIQEEIYMIKQLINK